MVTGLDHFHYEMADRAIEAFFQQTYPNKHLIIVNDGDLSLKATHPKRITEIRPKKRMPLGKLRNIALRKVPKNAMWVQWDDDDWNHPLRIEKQYQDIRKRKLAGSCLARFYYYSFEKDSIGFNGSTMCPGTIMCRKKPDVKYPPERRVGEDAVFRTRYRKKYRLKSYENPRGLLYKFIHGKNVWAKSQGKGLEQGWRGEEEDLKILRYILNAKYFFVKDY